MMSKTLTKKAAKRLAKKAAKTAFTIILLIMLLGIMTSCNASKEQAISVAIEPSPAMEISPQENTRNEISQNDINQNTQQQIAEEPESYSDLETSDNVFNTIDSTLEYI